MLELHTLGAVDLRGDGDLNVRPILLQQKRLALFIYLAVATPRGFHSREALMSLFWPELDGDRARNALRQAVFFLRSTLGQEVVAGRGKGDVGLAEGAVWCDAVGFDQALKGGDLEAAVELYHGDFLSGFHVADASPELEFWMDGERARLRLAALNAFRNLADREESGGRPQAAAALLRRAVLIDPDDERSVRRLIALLGELGDHTGAAHIYESFSQRTMAEYGVSPSPETERVMQTVRERVEGGRERPVAPATEQLPVPLTPLVGREREVRSALGLLQRPDVRLLTLTGPGGMGKTRLALELAARYGSEKADTVRFVPLASIQDAGLVPATIAGAVGAPVGKTPRESLHRFLGRRDLLLVLDNFEHLSEAAVEIVELLQAAPGVKILTTSRAALRVRGERAFEVPALSLPEPGETALDAIASSDAVALFVDRARAVRGGFRLTEENAPAVAEVCRRLDGLPLALELAAARTRLFGPEALVEQLTHPFDLLKAGPRDLPQRHQALEATIRWSYDLLSPDEQALLRRCAQFVAGAPLEAVIALWKAGGGTQEEAQDLATSLIEKSMLHSEPPPETGTRVAMLATVREFGLLRLEAEGESGDWARWQARYWLSWAEPGEGTYCTVDEPAWFERLDREHDNLRAALGWALEGGDVETALRLGTVLWWYWWSRGHFAEGRRWIERALARGGELSPSLRARALLGAGQLAGGQGDQRRAIRRMDESLALYRAMGDDSGVALLLLNLGYAHWENGDAASARDAFDESLALRRKLGDARGESLALESLAAIADRAGHLDEARAMFEESRELSQKVGHRAGVARALLGLGRVAFHGGDVEQAADLFGRAVERYRALHQLHGLAEALCALAGLEIQRGAPERAFEHYAEALNLNRRGGYIRGMGVAMIGIATVLEAQGRRDRAGRVCGGVDAMLESEAVTLEPKDQERFETTRAAARAALGETTFAYEWAEGRRMSLEDTIAFALDSSPAGPAGSRARRAAG